MNGLANWFAAIYSATALIIPVIMAVTFHEASHGFVAYQFGDDTALRAGRVTFNPLKHIDPFGTIVLPALLYLSAGFLFGYAKPVPVDFRRLNHPRRDMVWVALAGPAMNVLLAIIASVLFAAGKMTGVLHGPLHSLPFLLSGGMDSVAPSGPAWFAENLTNALVINVLLCVFNMLPLPPLDGGRVAVGVLPRFLALPLARLEPYGMLILMVIFIVSYAGARSMLGFSLLGWLIGGPADALIRFVLTITGQNG